jgi:hypothetical protein
MNNIIQIRQINRDEVNYLIRNLNDFEKDKAVKGGLMSAGKVFLSGGKSRLKRRMKSGSQGVTGNLLQSFHVRVKRSKPGVLAGFKQGKNGGSHSHLIDKGTNERYWKTKNKPTGRVIASRFWSDTEAQDYPKAVDKLYIGIEKAVNRISSRR